MVFATNEKKVEFHSCRWNSTRFGWNSTRFGWVRRGLAAAWVQMAPRTLPGGPRAGLQGTYFYLVAGSDLSEILCMSSNTSKCLAKLGRPAERTVTNVKSIPRNAHSFRDFEDAFRQATSGTKKIFPHMSFFSMGGAVTVLCGNRLPYVEF